MAFLRQLECFFSEWKTAKREAVRFQLAVEIESAKG
jgi:hypothetical protein